ncbi:ImmA/IrrE family metallo-endopeptidase [Nocardiopsis kunsanensis]|uniref:ImmA/IrrE family metallo-endopeptidase n=1 Tax=Nocardiopsis kunsanensis TaxID=141693 RepID=UPI00034DC10E|nr:XRE family transcriptional regulator [Nocardiopsis kunsanensis]
MTMTDIGARIERARAAAGLSQRSLADATGLSQSSLSRIISGARPPKMPELVAIAWETGHTVAQLTGTGVSAERAQCAARATNDSDMDGMRRALLDFLELDEYLDDQAIPATTGSRAGKQGPETVNAEQEGRTEAERFRREQNLGMQPLGDLVAIIEQAAGIDVAVLDADQDEHGLTMRAPERGAVFIAVARTEHPMRQRSTLAHELGHVLFEDWVNSDTGGWSNRSPGESRANAFARHLLVPVEGLRAFLGERGSIGRSDLSAVVQRFLVSPKIASIALHQAGYIDLSTKKEWMALFAPGLATRFGWSDQYLALRDDSARRRAPQQLLARAIRGYAEGVLSVQAIATLRGLARGDTEVELRKAGVVPSDRPAMWADHSELPEPDVGLSALDEALDVPDEDTEAPDTTASDSG